MTLFRLYSENGHYAGFWVQHRLWANACARLTSINGRCSGKLREDVELRGDCEITLESFDVRSGRRLDSKPPPVRDTSYVRIAEPAWSRPRRETRRAGTRFSSC